MFEANNPKHWDKILTQHREIFDKKLEDGDGSVQLRLQGIDALETHYSPMPVPPPREVRGLKSSKAEKPKPGKFRQPANFGDEATAELLEYLGVTGVKWRSGFGRTWLKEVTVGEGRSQKTYKTKGKDEIEGFIVVNDMDRKGRPISWVFPGGISERDGSRLTTSELLDIVKKSVNYRLVARGLVYPYFFMTLSADLRDPLIYAMKNAQRQQRKLWSYDKTQDGISIRKFSQIMDDHLIFPYLFRRMVKHQFRQQMKGYWEALKKKRTYKPDLDEVYLEAFFEDTNPYVFLIEERDFVRLDTIIHVTETKMKLHTHPGNLVFLS